jgi:hypothetical protein
LSAEQDHEDRFQDSSAREYLIERAARSVTELQSSVNNLADVMVFLEVLGYTDSDARKAGLADLYELSVQVFQRIDFYDDGTSPTTEENADHKVPVPSVRKRVIESLSLATPWLGAMALLYAFGVSLWLAWGLPLGPVTGLMIGVLLGLLVSEGPMQAFTRIFTFHHLQGNVSECRRALKRSYMAITMLLVGSLGALAVSSYLLKVPWELMGLAAVAAVTVAVHRMGYLPIYALKKTNQIVISYAIALPLLAIVYESTGGYFPDPVIRYLVSLSASLSVLSVFAWYNSKKSLVIETDKIIGKDAPSFFKPIFINPNSIASKFSVQFWEALPYYLFGTFFFILIFSDRVLSWLGNPVKQVGGVFLPMVFNSVYHAGADMALVVLFPVAILQYVMLSSVHEELNNLSLDLRITQTEEVDKFIRRRYTKALNATLLVSLGAAALVIAFGPDLVARTARSPISLQILNVAVPSDVLLCLFVVNSSFIILLNRPQLLTLIAMTGAALVAGGGLVLLPLGFQYLVYAYLVGCVSVAVLSTAYVAALLRSPSKLYFSRF